MSSQLFNTFNFTKFLKISHNLRLLSSIVSKGGVTQSNSINQNVDLLSTNLKESQSTEDLLALVKTHHPIMNSQHVIEALNRIFALEKRERSKTAKTTEIQSHPSFEYLCSKLKSTVGLMDADEVLDALKVITLLNVPSDSTIYQILLQILRHNINQLSINQIVFLNFLLKKSKRTPLSEALQLALPIVFEAQIPVKLDTSHVKNLVQSLGYASKTNVGKPCVELIINALLRHRLNDKMSLAVLWALCDLTPANFYQPLLCKVLKNLTIRSNKLSNDELETSVTKLAFRHSSKFPFFYDQEFFDVYAKRIVEEDLGFECAVHFLRKVLKMDYYNHDVFDYILKTIKRNPDLLKMGDPCHIYYLVCYAALSDYRLDDLEVLKNSLNEVDCLIDVETKNNLLRYATSLCIIGVYSPKVLEKVLSTEYLDMVQDKRFIFDLESVLLISQLIKTYKPELTHMLPNNDVLLKFRYLRKIDFPLTGLLHKVFGGENFIRTNVFSKMHQSIDHVLILRKGGFAVPVDNNEAELEDIVLDSSSQMILIMALPRMRYTIREKRMKGPTAMAIKTLQDRGYNVVSIDLDYFNRCPDFEKIPYIMEQIKQKTDYLEKISGVV